MRTHRVVLLTSESEPGRMAARYLAARLPALAVIVESPVPRSLVLRRRLRRLGLAHVGGQLERLQPQAILVVGTRLIAEEVLRAIDAPFINYHAGITPKYRGVHGGYWAQAEGDPGNFGVTVHLVDRGIDTGEVLYQERLAPSANDNYSTFPYLQLVAALPLLERAARDAVNGTLRPEKLDLPSKLWSHPTLWQYIKTGLRRGVW